MGILTRDTVIFDLDGTLVDSMWVWEDIDVNYLGQYGFTPTQDMKVAIEGMSIRETAVYFKERYGIRDSIVEIQDCWNRMAFDRYREKVRLRPHAEDFLRTLHGAGVSLGLATSNSRILAETVLASNGVIDLFDEIQTGEDVASGKPDPEIYLKAAAGIGAAPERCLVFEDVLMGVLAGKNAGMKVCAVYDPWNEPQMEEIRKRSDFFITDYSELAKQDKVLKLLEK